MVTQRAGAQSWTVAVAVKPLQAAKSRLSDVLSTGQRAQLAHAMACDVIRAALGASTVGRCVVVTADHQAAAAAHALGAEVLAEPNVIGLNAAFRLAQSAVGRHPLALLVADLPALTAAVLDRLLPCVPPDRAGVVGDADYEGTTMLAARYGSTLRPRFGPDSLSRHRHDGAIDLTQCCPVDARRDIDDAAALDTVHACATVGYSTRLWLTRHRSLRKVTT
jgi:2-phospho-L-lactate/phosphoenolpyruvate guanylyltransferase